MIEILEPGVDDTRIAEVLAPASGLRYVDAWKCSLQELAEIARPDRDPDSVATYLAANWTEEAVERSSRYIVYPWRRTVVRLPDSERFWDLRTARNRYLLDHDEQRQWSSALIAIAGLSVGGSVLSACSLTGARRFHLADHDTLAPTNLNRLQGSVCDLDEPKLVLAQRRTLEMDPYSQITPFPDGYTPQISDRFLGLSGERPAVLLEEMDNLAMKVHIRIVARAAGVPVVMATDNGDNVIVDVERFDLDPDYPLFHGRAGELTGLTGDELSDPANRVRIANAIVGSEVTPRTRYSLTQVGRTLPSWPQMGTAATAAGAIGALAARYVVCDKTLASGRYRLDLDRALVGDHAGAAERWNELDEESFRAMFNTA